jgi:fatty-acyl-CoA synthase
MNSAALFWQACDREPPGRVAIATEAVSSTFGEVRDRVSGLTHALVRLGVRPGDRVAIGGRNCPEFIEASWACSSVGAIAVPLNFRLTPHELALVCGVAQARLYFCDGEFARKLRQAVPDAEGRIIAWGSPLEGTTPYGELARGKAGAEPVVVGVDSDAVATILFTGGTSGAPKAVGRTHRNVLSVLLMAPGNGLCGSNRTVFAATPMFHVAGQLAVMALALGNTVVVAGGSFSAQAFLRLVERFRVNTAFVVPTMVAQLSLVGEDEAFDTSSLRELRSGGAPLPLEVAQRLVRRFPSLRFGNGAGSTEGGTYASGWWGEIGGRSFGCIGRPPIGQEIRIRGGDGAWCGPGEVGEIEVRGGQVAAGFWNDATRTEEAYGGGWLHTGDLGHVDADGYLYLVDRRTDLIISGGENIYARELEEALHSLPGVGDAAVIGVPDERWGEVPVAILTLRDSAGGVAGVESAMAERVAGYKRPKRYIVVDALPHTAVGKVDKRALRALAVGP